jgi:hypothetical protein
VADCGASGHAEATCRRPECIGGAASSLDEGDEMTTTVEDIIAGVEVLTTIPEWFGGGGAGGTDKRGETKLTVLKRFPLELNRWDSHGFRDGRVFRH